MKVLILAAFVYLTFAQDDYSDRGTNAANVASAGIDACRNTNSNAPQSNTIPYLTSNSYMISALGVLGGVLKQQVFHNRKMGNNMKDSMNGLNNRFDELENDMNYQFAQLTSFVDRKQFQTDITDPTMILWGEMVSYAQWPNNNTEANMRFECMRQTPWQIAIKLRNRLIGPDNSLMTQIQGKQWSNQSFMIAKDVVMARMFQLMMVQSFCVGVENGPNYNFTESWEMQRMYNIYSDIVTETVASRRQQETDYFQEAVPSVVRSIVPGNKGHGQYQQYANDIYWKLTQQYQWDQFGVVVADAGCDHIGEHPQQHNISGYQPYSSIKVTVADVEVFVIRYWIGQTQGSSRNSTYEICMQNAFNNDPIAWGDYVNCGQSYNILSDNWWCGGDIKYSQYVPYPYYFVSGVRYHDGFSSAVWPSQSRPTSIEYDLGFWERPIPIQLLPIPS